MSSMVSNAAGLSVQASQRSPSVEEPDRTAVRGSFTADPSPLGLFGYALTLGVLSFIHLGVLPAATTPLVVAMSLPVGGIGMILAGMWAFRRGNTFGATALTGYGVFWVNYYLLFSGLLKGIPKPDQGPVLGIWLFFWGIFTLVLFAGSLKIDRAHPFFLSFLVITFGVLGLGQMTGNAMWIHLGGWTGLISIAGAMYVAASQITEAQFGKRVLPV